MAALLCVALHYILVWCGVLWERGAGVVRRRSGKTLFKTRTHQGVVGTILLQQHSQRMLNQDSRGPQLSQM